MPWIRSAIAGALLIGPALLGFFAGGYFDRPRLWAGVVAWLLVVAAAIACPRPWPRHRAAWVAIGGLGGLTLWTALSLRWTPLRDAALADTQRLALYLGVLIAGVAVLRDRGVARAAEPALALGILALVIEGLSERLLPGLFTLQQSSAAPGRLLQPLTYWNAMGALAAIGVLLCVRIAGDVSRPVWMRAAAAAATPTLATAGYLTLSRGAILAVVVGITLLMLLQPVVAQARALVILALSAAPAVLAAGVLDGVRALAGSASTRSQEGVAMLVVLAGTSLAAALAVRRDARIGSPTSESPVLRRMATVMAALAAIGVVITFSVLTMQREHIVPVGEERASNARLVSSESVRGDFSRVSRDVFADHVVRGIGSGGYAAAWLRERPIPYATRDAHSLYFETPAELGIVGLGLLLAFLGGVAACARQAVRRDRALAAGPVAVLGAWAVHAGLDWDWEMPTLAIVALLMAAVLIARADDEESTESPASGALAEPAPRERQAEVVL